MNNNEENTQLKQEHEEDDGELEPEQFRKVFVGGLSSDTTDDSLREFYSKWGELLDCIVMKDPTTKRTRGFGFIVYKKQSMVDDAMANRPHVIDGKTVDPKRAVPRDQSLRTEANVSSKRLYVSGIREEHTEEMLHDHFSQYGNITKVEIITDKNTGKPRGFAFISFDDHDPVDKCVLIKNHHINNYRCDVKKALSKDEMARAQQRDRDRSGRMGRSRGGPMRNGSDRGYGPPPYAEGGYGGGWAGGPAEQQWGPSGGRQPYYGGWTGGPAGDVNGGAAWTGGAGSQGSWAGQQGGGQSSWGGSGGSQGGSWAGQQSGGWSGGRGY